MSPSLDALLRLPEHEQQAMGITATAREIAQQPATWRGTQQVFARHAASLRALLEPMGFGPAANATGRRPAVVLAGAGTSDYIGQALAFALRSGWGCEVHAVPSTDLLTNLADFVTPGQPLLVISFSRSGDSPEGVHVLQTMLDELPEVAHLVVTCNRDARMAQMLAGCPRACAVVLDDAVNDRSLAMTSSFSNMVVFGQCLAHLWSAETYEPIFDALVRAGEAFLPEADRVARSMDLAGPARACFLGSGALKSVARESALKVLEMSGGRIQTMSESVMGLRHGPMAALNAHTLLVCFASGDPRRQNYEADLLEEIGAKGVAAQRIAVAPRGAARIAAAAECFLPLEPGVPDAYRPPLDVMLGQLLGFHGSLAHGLQPDSPSPQGIISRVVGSFRTY